MTTAFLITLAILFAVGLAVWIISGVRLVNRMVPPDEPRRGRPADGS